MTDRIWQLRHNITAYDASYVALAEHLGMPLITAERRLAAASNDVTSAQIETYVVSDTPTGG